MTRRSSRSCIPSPPASCGSCWRSPFVATSARVTRLPGSAVTLERGAVQVNAEARLLGNGDGAVDEAKLLRCQLLAQARLTELGREELDVRAVRRRGGQVRGGRDGDPGLPEVRDDG